MSLTVPPAASTSPLIAAKTFASCSSSVGGRVRVPGLDPPITLDMTMLPIRLALGIGFSCRGAGLLMLWRLAISRSLFRGGFGGAEDRHVFALVGKRGGAFGRQRDGEVQRGIDIAFPNLARQFVEQLHAV